MAGDIKVQSGSILVRPNTSTPVTETIESLISHDSAFVRITNVTQVGGTRDIDSGANLDTDDVGFTAQITDINTISFRGSGIGENADYRVAWEVIEYVGTASGSNEFRVRFNEQRTATGFTDSFSVTGALDTTKLVPFIAGVFIDRDRSDIWPEAPFEVSSSGDTFTVTRDRDVSEATYAAQVIEFTGENWTVFPYQLNLFSGTTWGTQVIPLDTSVTDWDNTWIIPTFKPEASRAADAGFAVWPGPDVDNIRVNTFDMVTKIGTPRLSWYMVENSNVSVEHLDSYTGGETNLSAGVWGSSSITFTNAVTLGSSSIIFNTSNDGEAIGAGTFSFMWNYRIASSGTFEVLRIQGQSQGSGADTEWAAQIIEWPEIGVDNITVDPGISSLESFGTADFNPQNILATGIPSEERFGDVAFVGIGVGDLKDIKVQRGIINKQPSSATATTLTLDETLGSLTSAFIRITNAHPVGGARDSQTEAERDTADVGFNLRIRDVNTIEVSGSGAGEGSAYRIAWEIIEYIGEADGPNEFIVRFSENRSRGPETDSITVPDVVDSTDLIPFLHGATQDTAGVQLDRLGWEVSGSGTTISLERGDRGVNNAIYSLTVVEFTGDNWTVHPYQANEWSGSAGTFTVPLDTSVTAWHQTIIFPSYLWFEDSDPTTGFQVFPADEDDVNNIRVRTDENAILTPAPRSSWYLLENADMFVDHFGSHLDQFALQSGSGPNIVPFAPSVALGSSSIWYSDTNDNVAGGANFVGMWNYRLDSTSSFELYRTANAGSTSSWSAQVVQWPGPFLLGPVGIQSLEEFGDHTVVDNPKIFPVGIQSLEEFGSPIQVGDINITVDNGIPSLEEIGSHNVAGPDVIDPTGITSEEDFGDHQVGLGILVDPGIASAEAFGTHTIFATQVITVDNGIPSLEEFGSPIQVGDINIVVDSGIDSSETFSSDYTLDLGGNVKVQRGTQIFNPSDSTVASATLVDPVNAHDRAFVRITNTSLMGGQRSADAGTRRDVIDANINVKLVNTSTIEFSHPGNGENVNWEVNYEVWEYVGPANGGDEFIVRHNEQRQVFGLNDSITVTGSNDVTDLVPFLHGATLSSDQQDIWREVNYQVSGSGATFDLTRDRAGSVVEYNITVVEFTGANWTVHGYQTFEFTGSTWGTNTVALDTGVVDWDNTFILQAFLFEASRMADTGIVVWPGPNSGSIRVHANDSAIKFGTPPVSWFLVENPRMQVQHIDSLTGGESNISAGVWGSSSIDFSDAVILPSSSVLFHQSNDDEDNSLGFFSWAWNYKLLSSGTFEIERNIGQAQGAGGDTEWAAQIINWPQGGLNNISLEGQGIQSEETFGNPGLNDTCAQWGEPLWGQAVWGQCEVVADTDLPVIDSKQDTVLLVHSSGSVDELADDIGQFKTDLTNNTTFVSEISSSRSNINNTREISGRFNAQNGTTGTVVYFGNNAEVFGENGYRVELDASQVLNAFNGDLIVASVALDTVGVNQQFSFNYSTKPNKTPRDPTDNLRHELWVYNHFTEGVVAAFGSGSTVSMFDTWTLTIKSNEGADIFTEDVLDVRIGRDFHSSIEFNEDYSQFQGPSLNSTQVSSSAEAPPLWEKLWFDKASSLGDAGQYWGPIPQQEAHVRANFKKRLVSPLINETYLNPPTFNVGTSNQDTTGSMWRQPPGSLATGWKMYLGWFKWNEIAEFSPVRDIFWRAHFNKGDTAGSDHDLHIRMYCFNRTAWQIQQNIIPNQEAAPPLVRYYDTVLIPSGTLSGWVSGSLKLSRIDINSQLLRDTTFFTLAISGSNVSDQIFTLNSWNAIQIDPLTEPNPGPDGINESLGS